jgi:hypothetical protein
MRRVILDLSAGSKPAAMPREMRPLLRFKMKESEFPELTAKDASNRPPQIQIP